MTDHLAPRLWPMAVVSVAVAFLVAWLVREEALGRFGGYAFLSSGGHGHGGSAGPAMISGDAVPHYLGLAAFTTHAALPVLAGCLVVARNLLTRFGRGTGGVNGTLAFAAGTAVAGVLVCLPVSWLAVRSIVGDTQQMLEVWLLSAAPVLRYCFLLGLVCAMVPVAWWSREPKRGTDALPT